MSIILKNGSTGENVKHLQSFLKLKVDGKFGPNTERSVKAWQKKNGLKDDGIVGPKTWAAMGLKDLVLTTDQSDRLYKTIDNLVINKFPLSANQYMAGPTKKEYIFLHHTAGWNDPYKTVTDWEKDNRGRVATQYVIGGPNIRNGDLTFDGIVVECFDDKAYAGHLGRVNSHYMHTHSVGIEICNFGFLKPAGAGYVTYTGQLVDADQVTDLGYTFRGYRYWHKYSDEQIQSLKKLIRHVAKLHGINITKGLIERLKVMEEDEAFEYDVNISNGQIKGILSHTNVRKDKMDIYPCPRLIKMLKSL
jgi:hypothetical protein